MVLWQCHNRASGQVPLPAEPRSAVMVIGVIGSGSIVRSRVCLRVRDRLPAGSESLPARHQEGRPRRRHRAHQRLRREGTRPRPAERQGRRRHSQSPRADTRHGRPCPVRLRARSGDGRPRNQARHPREDRVGGERRVPHRVRHLRPSSRRDCRQRQHPERCFVNHPFFPAWRALPIEVVLSGDEVFGNRNARHPRHARKVRSSHPTSRASRPTTFSATISARPPAWSRKASPRRRRWIAS